MGGVNRAQAAADEQMRQMDLQQAATIHTQVRADAQKQEAQRRKIEHDTQTKIFEITQDVTVHRAKTADKAANAFSAYLRA